LATHVVDSLMISDNWYQSQLRFEIILGELPSHRWAMTGRRVRRAPTVKERWSNEWFVR
jgi:hypothetical protein